MINCLIVEDQLPAQRILKTYLKDAPQIKLIGACQTAIEANNMLRVHEIELIFLDINLPKISGISFLRNLKTAPKVIITSAYAEYALEGFELDVVDYLLKPFSFERFFKAVDKALRQLEAGKRGARPYIFIKTEKDLHKVNIEDILYLKADDNFVRIHASDKMHIQAGSLQKWVSDLPDSFARIHRSYAVNLSKLTKVSGNRVFLSEIELPIGRAFREQFLSIITSNR